MKRLQYLAFALCLLALSVATTSAQKRTTHKTTSTRTTTGTTVPPLEVRAARQKVDIQLSNVNNFLGKLGPFAADLETAIADERGGKLKPETSAKVDQIRANFVKSIHDLGTALNTLESEFRTKPPLSKYFPMIQGITDLAGKSEDSAAAGQFIAAKDPLREVVKRLTDTLNAMPKSEI